ncbi:bifunctional UDP-N-acetylglucosamine diphosphorylase/glucosamine-1-phosphate N-acetyltransferase GlmU [Gloeobacter morelensis]|uniref:Bifunctional protein GlmU n=1 Tax=Gloeobacter morelensis MG652769 TaxID=2781736 RepID=A0ABY3PP57_9CYAN|nr:bifunctional UDP-N-acetylglucosamine diphosphorylase/glucosamine-1-phosphate N-acetyltransferase GlmU [Gloeobacter morelensis]UFP95442.1 bifunctional UDP-N-acetylglucosamine diphosphorylase/glucosamine-1-phosphate N-acetyltransferase GlmU [Gloeobacter morelensis MG652769]
MSGQLAAIVLAAGKGTRMRSTLPKVLHPLAGSTILERVLAALGELALAECFIVVGQGADLVRGRIARPGVQFVEQTEQRGTGHAVQQVIPHLEGFEGEVLVLNGDAPLLRPSTVAHLVEKHRSFGADATILAARIADPGGYGRVFLGAEGRVRQVIEDRDCTEEQRRNDLINGGVYCFRWPALSAVLPALSAANDQGELYLPDALPMLTHVRAVAVEDPQEIFGINDRVQLAQASRILNERALVRLMLSGVTIVDPLRVTIDETVEIEPDVVIEPETHLRGATRIASGCRIGPGALLEDTVVGTGTEILYSVLRRSRVGAHSTVGPYSHLRSGADVGSHCRVGNFVEIKNATIGDHTNAAHLSYVGDARVGERVNFGAGTIVVNYDGKHKHHTEIGDGVRTGANSCLVAPLKLGDGVTVAAGSTVTEDVPSGLVIARSRQVVKPNWQPPYERTEEG